MSNDTSIHIPTAAAVKEAVAVAVKEAVVPFASSSNAPSARFLVLEMEVAGVVSRHPRITQQTGILTLNPNKLEPSR
jgi:hypothetical protein